MSENLEQRFKLFIAISASNVADNSCTKMQYKLNINFSVRCKKPITVDCMLGFFSGLESFTNDHKTVQTSSQRVRSLYFIAYTFNIFCKYFRSAFLYFAFFLLKILPPFYIFAHLG